MAPSHLIGPETFYQPEQLGVYRTQLGNVFEAIEELRKLFMGIRERVNFHRYSEYYGQQALLKKALKTWFL